MHEMWPNNFTSKELVTYCKLLFLYELCAVSHWFSFNWPNTFIIIIIYVYLTLGFFVTFVYFHHIDIKFQI